MNKSIGQQTISFESQPKIISSSAIVGPKEGDGPLGEYFDKVLDDSYYQQDTWEKAERKMTKENIDLLLTKAKLSPDKIDYLVGGDLLNQVVTSNFSAVKFPVPYFGIYGACSTLAEGLILGAVLIDGGFGNRVINFTSSHYQSAERQYRTPNEYGDKYPPYKQWTATGAGAMITSRDGSGPVITEATPGQVVDLGIKDPQDMGSAMAPAAADTILQHLEDTGRTPNDYDLIVTGDLGEVGSEILAELLKEKGVDIADSHDDCGLMLYNSDQGVGAGGSGCACSAVVTASYLLPYINNGNFNRIFVVATGSLLSSVTSLQGDSIPCIAHGVVIENNSKSNAVGSIESKVKSEGK
ncbi:stage V sporulation protein AD [Acetohalobium arabaticum]|uniref:Stage V sporulation protein AD n=1 Tax=Acetohalobium arabaticum (strain ATCC 49924 / DSM 5501 / Z-7288) TaxID=574087 RepID=D9QRR6_ACEAZ|nr:stage V sporulation protein AD [Acetohalobium arabaticum]ADL13207.1 stage V sporulation protein AD [Acetohalobium arabaticum DSM 5501]